MDIKKNKRRKNPKPNSQEPDLSFLKEEQPGDVNEIEQPQHLTYKLGAVFKQRSLIEAVVAVLLFGGGLALGLQFSGSRAQPEPKPVVVEKSPPVSSVAGSHDELFPADAFHRIELVSGDVYYSLITSSDSEYYRLSNVFYTVRETESDGVPPKITLAMYEQAEDQPAGDLLLPADQVKAVSQLNPESAVVRAIEQYLLEEPTEGEDVESGQAEEPEQAEE